VSWFGQIVYNFNGGDGQVLSSNICILQVKGTVPQIQFQFWRVFLFDSNGGRHTFWFGRFQLGLVNI
jgi:hypothetical protein